MEGHEVFPAVLQLEGPDFRVSSTRNTLEKLHVGRVCDIVGRVQRGKRGEKCRAVVRIQLTEDNTIAIIRDPCVLLGRGRGSYQDAVNTLTGGRTKTRRSGL